MDGTFVDAVADVPLQLQPLEDAGSAPSFQKALLDLGDSAMPARCCVHPQVSQDIVVLGIMLLKVSLERPGRLFAAGNEASLVSVDLEARRVEQVPQGPISQNGFPGDIVRISATDIKGDIINPCLKSGGWVGSLELLERPKEDQLADGSLARCHESSAWGPLQCPQPE